LVASRLLTFPANQHSDARRMMRDDAFSSTERAESAKIWRSIKRIIC
jgi:hypothetical protein